MKRIVLALSALILSAGLFAQDAGKSNFKFYGFIRNYAHLDTKECVAGTGDVFSYLPKDSYTDVNSFHFTAITSRVGVDVSGYNFGKMAIGAKIEADFYAGLSGVTGTATLRLRQAFLTLGWKDLGIANANSLSVKIGQAWHPLAADMPDVFSLNTGAPFGPFSRTPLAQVDYNFGKTASLTAALIWQMQYTSCGPEGSSANYVKYCGIPEIYLGGTKNFNGGFVRLGVNILSIKPTIKSQVLTTVTPFLYAQYKKDLFVAKFKTVLAQDGSHFNLNGGYGLCSDGLYTPTRNSSSWLSLAYGKKLQAILFLGYVKNFGTAKAVEGPTTFYFSKNSFANVNSMFRTTPTVVLNLGKLALGLEWEMTGVEYGDKLQGMNLNNGLYDKGLHWVVNNRIQTLIKYTF